MLRCVVCVVRDTSRAVRFWEALGLETLAHDAEAQFAELKLQGDSTLVLKGSTSEASLSSGYSPLLSFEVPQGQLASKVPELIQLGASLDGPIVYPSEVGDSTVATLRAPDAGVMVSLLEPNVAPAPQKQ